MFLLCLNFPFISFSFQNKFRTVSKKKPGSLKRCEIKRKSLKKKINKTHQLRVKFDHFIEHLHLPTILHLRSSHSNPEHLHKSLLTNQCNLIKNF